jgi:hypothetical protein
MAQGLSVSLFAFSYTQQTECIIIKEKKVILVNKIVSGIPEPVRVGSGIWLSVYSLGA